MDNQPFLEGELELFAPTGGQQPRSFDSGWWALCSIGTDPDDTRELNGASFEFEGDQSIVPGSKTDVRIVPHVASLWTDVTAGTTVGVFSPTNERLGSAQITQAMTP